VDLRRVIHRLITLAIPAGALATALSAGAIEIWVRLAWDEQRGRPGFYLSDPELGQRLAPGYEGWFAGVPVRINALGFRDNRDYELAKSPRVFRIIVLGDSVTFGHGATSDTTYPFLLERRLREWKPGVDWQVWNLGVPGYATSQELTYLRRVAARYQPDLAIVGFYQNDLTGNEPAGPVSAARRARSAVQRVLQRRLYSYEFYKRAILTVRWRLFTEESARLRLEHLVTQEIPLVRRDYSAGADMRELTDVDEFDQAAIDSFVCAALPRPDLRVAESLRARLHNPDPEMSTWLEAVQGFGDTARRLGRPLVFFVNMAPEICVDADRFFDGGSLAVDAILQDVLADVAPVVSSGRAYLRYRPSQMPLAGGHAIGNANRVKADVLFEFLAERVLSDVATQTDVRHLR
jgi:hypothetical protein